MIGLWLAALALWLETPRLSPFGGPIAGHWGYPTSRAFGAVEPGGARHAGVDIAAPCGTPVVAMGAGEVVLVSLPDDPDPSGRRVVVRHRLVNGGALYIEYAHLMEVAVATGRVAPGVPIGRVGAAAPGEGCHLHLASRRHRRPDGGRTRGAPGDIGYVDPTGRAGSFY